MADFKLGVGICDKCDLIHLVLENSAIEISVPLTDAQWDSFAIQLAQIQKARNSRMEKGVTHEN